jgi:hypothetical protein
MEAFLTSAMLKKNSSVQHQVAKWQTENNMECILFWALQVSKMPALYVSRWSVATHDNVKTV